MRRTGPILLVLALLTACAGTPVTHAPTSHARESQVTDINDLAQVATTLAANGTRRTLLVLDIDDTLLTSQGFFGSDKWYEWQKHLPATDPAKVSCLFDVISLNYETGTQQPTQPDGPALINALPGDKLMLTSRNLLYRGGTLRTLHDAGYALPTPLAGQTEGRSWRWRKAPDARESEVGYDQGIFMTAGQDKGLVLLNLLGRLQLQLRPRGAGRRWRCQHQEHAGRTTRCRHRLPRPALHPHRQDRVRCRCKRRAAGLAGMADPAVHDLSGTSASLRRRALCLLKPTSIAIAPACWRCA